MLALSEEGKKLYIPFPQFGHIADRANRNDWKGQYYRKMRHLVLEAGEEHKEVYRHIFDFGGENNSLGLLGSDLGLDLDTDDFLSYMGSLRSNNFKTQRLQKLYKFPAFNCG